MTGDQANTLTAGGHVVMMNRSASGLWSITRTRSNAYHKGPRSQKSSSYSLNLAVEDLVAQTERSLISAASEGIEA